MTPDNQLRRTPATTETHCQVKCILIHTNGLRISAFRYYVVVFWLRTLRRRSQKDRFTWERIKRLADDWLPQPRTLHPWPSARFAVKYSR